MNTLFDFKRCSSDHEKKNKPLTNTFWSSWSSSWLRIFSLFLFWNSCVALTDSATSQLCDHKHHKTDLSDTFSYHATKPSKVHQRAQAKRRKRRLWWKNNSNNATTGATHSHVVRAHARTHKRDWKQNYCWWQ